MKRVLKIAIFILLFIFCIYYTYYLRPFVDDELYNFGFAINILNGRIPYLDFNMIIPPLFPYILSIILKLFGNKLIIYHMLLSLLIVGVTYITSKKIGFRAIALTSIILIYPFTGYNTFALFLFMILLCNKKKETKHQNIIDALIVSMIFLTKQTLGILIIPELYYSKNKKKSLAIYLLSMLILLIYLIENKSLYLFIDYCFLGMLDFTTKNSNFSLLFTIEILIIGILLIIAIKKRKREYYEVLCFQIISLPAVNYVHFMVAFIPVIYLLILHFKKSFVGTIFLTTFAIVLFILFSLSFHKERGGNQFLSQYPDNNFMKNRLAENATYNYIHNIGEFLEKYKDYDAYILANYAYLVKLNLNLSINKYDIINNGNMGYKGYKGYIKEIDNHCKKNKCIFILNDNELSGKVENQVNRNILYYVQESYTKHYASNIFSIYTN